MDGKSLGGLDTGGIVSVVWGETESIGFISFSFSISGKIAINYYHTLVYPEIKPPATATSAATNSRGKKWLCYNLFIFCPRGGVKMADLERKEQPTAPPEIHEGIVVSMEEDYAEVIVANTKELRRFETPFLEAIGIKVGDRIKVELEEEVEPGVGTITMKVRGLGPETDPEVIEAIKVADFMRHIRQTFGSLVYDSRNQS